MREPLKAGRVTSTDSHAFLIYRNKAQSGESKGHDRNIMKKNKKEELQSRRQFFKNAAKGVLPILGAIVMAQMPLMANATHESEKTVDCYYNCGGSCTGTCDSQCDGSCKWGCLTTCTAVCNGNCSGTCTGTCEGSCNSSCYGLSY